MQTRETSNEGAVSNLYRNYVLAMLTLVYVFNFVDRQLLVILQESIKRDLHLSDTQLGVLSGFTFALFYVTLGIPIARLADKTNRRNTVAASLAIWSIMTAGSGLVRNYIQLLLARVGVGIGEAGGSPPAHAMLSDYFPPEKRSTALSIYSTGIYFGILTGFLLGGYLNQRLGWRTAFFVVGIPGIIFSLLFYTSVKEPQRGVMDRDEALVIDPPSLREVLKRLYSTKTFVYLAMATGLHVFCIYGLLNWAPSFLARLHGMTQSEIGALLGPIFGIGGAVGSFAGGLLTDYLGKRDKGWYLKAPAYAIIVSIPCAAGALFLQNTVYSVICLGLSASLHSMYLGPSVAVAHSLVPASMRSLTSAILFFVLNFIGLGFGPLVVGMISDQLTPSLGIESLRWAMSIIIIISFGSTALFLIAAKKLAVDLKLAR
ncbi:MFS transporter [Spirosoma sp. KCTC 42546]|uniref:spinster family MFS transporter n=1 Tax=Spirosoma sp. KCTC 42546 TaxID=2520506 RepID=UPI0011594EF7|nr:MFS transporter [Spirosoma sp. KCTC 42546]QDK77162.1 MFS transporter [Spirosoma sp. KCTC 42546]